MLVVISVVATGCWTQYRGDIGHSASQPFEVGIDRSNVSTLGPAWIGQTGSRVEHAAAFGNGSALVVANDGTLSAFDAAGLTGCSGTPRRCAPQWTASVDDRFQSTPAAANGIVYVQGLDAVYAFDADGTVGCTGMPRTCSPLWRTTSIGYARSAVTVSGTTLYAAGGRGLSAFDAMGIRGCGGIPRLCAPLWTSTEFVPTGDAAPAIADGRVFVSDGDELWVFDDDGTLGCSGEPVVCAPLWSAGDAQASPVVVDGVVYLAGGPHGLNALDAAGIVNCAGSPRRCQPLWTTTLETTAGPDRPAPAVAGGVAYLTVDDTLVAFDAHGRTGCGGAPRACAALWSTDVGASGAGPIAGAPTVANGVVYVDDGRRAVALAADGRTNCGSQPVSCDRLWFSRPGPTHVVAPVVVAGTLFTGSDGGLAAFRPGVAPAAPTIDAVGRASRGRTTVIDVTGTGFTADITVSTTIPGATVDPPTQLTATHFTVAITVPAGAPNGTFALQVTTADGRRATSSMSFDTGSAADVRARGGISGDPILLFENPPERDADLDAIAALGGNWLNLDVVWHWIQRDGPDSADWTTLDRVVLAAHDRGLQILGTVAYSPTWAFGADCPAIAVADGHCLPADLSAYARFIGLAAARYGSRSDMVVDGRPLRGTITHWQVWNEPNIEEFSRPGADPVRYTDMLKRSYFAVRAADPTAFVLTGSSAPAPDAEDGTSYLPTTWLRRLYEHGARGYFDGVGHHPWSFPTNPLDAQPWNAFAQTMSIYGVMIEFGDGDLRIWGTEMGAPTGTSVWALSEADQAKWIRDYYTGWNTNFAAFTGPMMLKSLRDLSPDPASVWENTGILRFDRTPKPAYWTFLDLLTNGVA